MKQPPKAYTALPFLADSAREAEDERLQEIRRATHGRGHFTEAERTVARGLALAETAAENIRIMEGKREQGLTRRADGGATLDMIAEEQAKLAEGLAATGRYREAADVHPLKTRAAEYVQLADAIERDDDDECSCPPTKRASIGQQSIDLPRRRITQRAFSLKHGRMVEVEACTNCPYLNARPARGILGAARQAQKGSARAGKAVMSDVQLLNGR